MKTKILLFLLSCVAANVYCMNKTENSFKKTPKKTITKHKKYSIKCPKCDRSLTKKDRSALPRALLVHLYSKIHKPILCKKYLNYITKNAYEADNKWHIKCVNQKGKLTASDLPKLRTSFISHKFCTRENNLEEYKKAEKYTNKYIEEVCP